MEIEFQGRYFRGTDDGEIHVSNNDKQSWTKQSGFGSQFSVHKLFTDIYGQLNAEMEFQGFYFNLVLAEDGSVWRVN